MWMCVIERVCRCMCDGCVRVSVNVCVNVDECVCGRLCICESGVCWWVI